MSKAVKKPKPVGCKCIDDVQAQLKERGLALVRHFQFDFRSGKSMMSPPCLDVKKIANGQAGSDYRMCSLSVLRKEISRMNSTTAYQSALAKRRTTVINRQPKRPKPESLLVRELPVVLALVDALMRTAPGSVEALEVLGRWEEVR